MTVLELEQLNVWHETLLITRPVVHKILQEYEVLCQQLSSQHYAFIHRELLDNLRARLRGEKGTCEGHWYHQALEQECAPILLKRMNRAYKFVGNFRAFQVHLQNLQQNPEVEYALTSANMLHEQLINLRSDVQVQHVSEHPLSYPPSAQTKILKPTNRSVSENVHSKYVDRTNMITSTKYVRLLSTNRSPSATTFHPPMLSCHDTNSSSGRYADYCRQILMAYQESQHR